ncbi:MAG: DUF2062 domain-containing protein [Alphaproteobacteria bacterium]
MGFHLLLAALTAWIIRGNILASALGTAAGNPWTFRLSGCRFSIPDAGCWAAIMRIRPRLILFIFLKKRPEPCCILILTCFFRISGLSYGL